MPAEPPKRLRLGRDRRIQQSRDFARTRLEGRRLVHGCLIANWRSLPASAPGRVGLVVSRKVGNAVVRSRVRRLLRESYRLHQHELLEPLDLVLVARPSIAGRVFADVERDFLATMRKAALVKTPA